MFPATSNKRETADNQKMDETYNIFGRSYEIHPAVSIGNRAGKVKIRTCQ